MSEFNEFDQQGSVPEKEAGSIISHAFEMYKGVFLYVLLAIAIYILGSWLIDMVSGFDTQSFAEEIRSSNGDYTNIDYWSVPGLKTYYGLSGLLNILLAPLYVGLIYIVNKYNTKITIQVSDLFIGYKQNFVNIIIYAFLTNIILGVSILFCIIPVFFVFPLFLIGYPILLFENASATEALSKSFNIAKENYATFLGAAILGILISLSGFILCCVGVFLTAFYIYIVMYSAYVAYQGKPKQIGSDA